MFNYTVKLVTKEDSPKANGNVPIFIRITIARRSSYISTGQSVPSVLWDDAKERIKDGYLLGPTINADITARKLQVIRKLAEIQVKEESVTADQAKRFFAKGDLTKVFVFADDYRDEVKEKREGGTLENYRKHISYLEDFHGSRGLSFEEIDHNYLVRFERYLRERQKVNKEKLSTNYIHLIFQTLRSFFNAARDRGIITHYPFATFEMPEYIPPDKAYLDFSELDFLEDYADSCKDPTRKETATYMLLGSYAGLRVSDWRTFDAQKHVKGDRLRLRAKKNGEWVTMPIVGRLARHLDRILSTPLSITVHEMNRSLKDIAMEGKIDKKLSTHVGRHTFAITMCAEQGVSAETCAELMGITIKTCVENYYKVTNRKIDRETLGAWGGL